MKKLAVLIGLLAPSAQAGPDATTQRFMTEAVSMMDWGLLRAEQWLNSEGWDVRAFYEWDSNRVVFAKEAFLPDMPENVERECKDWVRGIRGRSFVSPDDGSLVSSSQKYSRIGTFFLHAGFTRTVDGKEDPEAVAELDKLIELRNIYWVAKGDGGYAERFRCEGLLRAGPISVTRP